jgi:small GTP-binding protein
MDIELTADPLTATGAQRDVVGATKKVLALSNGLLPASARRHLLAGLERLEASRFNLVVVGEFKRGKSTLINALLARELLPSGVVPLTSAVTVLRGGERNRVVVRFEGGRSEEHDLSALVEYATESGNPKNVRGVDEVVVELDHGLLTSGLQLIDTPGIGSIHDHNTEVAESFLPQVDAALCVLAADQPLSAEEARFFDAAGASAPRLIFAVNKIDMLAPDERGEAVDFIRRSLAADRPGQNFDLYPVSAKTGEGIASLADHLGELSAGEGKSLASRSVLQLAAGLAEDAANAADLEREALGLPLEELERRVALFEDRAESLERMGIEAADLLESNVKRLIKERLNEPLISYAKDYGPELVRELEAYAEAQSDESPKDLAELLETWIARTIGNTFAQLADRYEGEVGTEMVRLESDYAQRIEQLLAELEQAAHEAFGGDAADRLRDVGLREPPRFTYKLKDPEHMLDRLVRIGRRSVPGRIGRRLVLAEARDRLVQMADRHAGRLRSELADTAMATVTEYQEDLAGTVAAAEESIRLAIDRARKERHRGESRIAERVSKLASLAQRLRQLAEELRNGTSESRGETTEVEDNG